MDKLKRAKEIFLSNYCSEFIIGCGSEDILREYESYNVDESIETEWTREFINERLMTMTSTNAVDKVSDMYLARICNYNDLIEEMCSILNLIYLDITNDDRMMILVRLDDIMRLSNICIKHKMRKYILKIILSIDTSQLSYTKLLNYKRIKKQLKKQMEVI